MLIIHFSGKKKGFIRFPPNFSGSVSNFKTGPFLSILLMTISSGTRPINWDLSEKTLNSTLDCKEIKPIHPKGNQPWIFIGRTVAEAKAPILWPLDVKSWLFWKDPDSGKDWWQEEKGTTEDEMVGWHHRLNGHGFGWTPGVGDRQEGLVCCGSWSHKESDTTERLNWTELTHHLNTFFFCHISFIYIFCWSTLK